MSSSPRLSYAILSNEQVARAVNALVERGFTRDAICVIRPDQGGSEAARREGCWRDDFEFPAHELTEGSLLVGVMLQNDDHIGAAHAALEAAGASEIRVLASRDAERKENERRIDEAIAESFPASDPPFWTSGWNGPPTPTPAKR